jgi:hypothetical protein
MTRMTGTSCESSCTYIVLSRWIFLRMRTVSEKFVVEIGKHFTFSKFFRNRGSLLEKYGMAR